MANSSGDKTAVILSGGGANGSYEVGVLKALFNGDSPATGYTPLNPAIFTGTSVGAYNAAVVVSHLEAGARAAVAYLEDIWLNVIPRDDSTTHNHVFRLRGDALELFDLDYVAQHPLAPYSRLVEDVAFFGQDWFRRGVNFLLSTQRLEERTLELVDAATLFSREPFERLVKKTVRLENIRGSDRKLKVVATNWKTGELRIFANEDMTEQIGHQAIWASTAIPGIFESVEIDGQPYVDGGVVMNTPLKPAIDSGADTLHVIYLDGQVSAIPLPRLRNTINTISRTLVIGFAAAMKTDIEVARRVNRSIDLLEKASTGAALAGTDRQGVSAPHRKITIHRYRPLKGLGHILGLLNFNRGRMIDLIERGVSEAVGHNCDQNDCVLLN